VYRAEKQTRRKALAAYLPLSLIWLDRGFRRCEY